MLALMLFLVYNIVMPIEVRLIVDGAEAHDPHYINDRAPYKVWNDTDAIVVTCKKDDEGGDIYMVPINGPDGPIDKGVEAHLHEKNHVAEIARKGSAEFSFDFHGANRVTVLLGTYRT